MDAPATIGVEPKLLYRVNGRPLGFSAFKEKIAKLMKMFCTSA